LEKAAGCDIEGIPFHGNATIEINEFDDQNVVVVWILIVLLLLLDDGFTSEIG
jgi:hypothetical protein